MELGTPGLFNTQFECWQGFPCQNITPSRTKGHIRRYSIARTLQSEADEVCDICPRIFVFNNTLKPSSGVPQKIEMIFSGRSKLQTEVAEIHNRVACAFQAASVEEARHKKDELALEKRRSTRVVFMCHSSLEGGIAAVLSKSLPSDCPQITGSQA
jgi:hypothetical protein